MFSIIPSIARCPRLRIVRADPDVRADALRAVIRVALPLR
jgi:hypothetical protein